MAENRRTYRVSALNLESINFAFGLLADRLDELEGRRGTPKFKANVDMGSNRIGSLGNAVLSADALPLGQADDAIDAATDPILQQDQKGALLVHNGTALTQLAVGADGSRLTADSSETVGVKWAPYYESDEQTITSGGSLTLAHGLGAEPKLIQCLLVCKTAEYNYSVGDKVFVDLGQQTSTANANFGMAILPDATNIYVRYGSYVGSSFLILDKSTCTGELINNTNWKLIIRAWA